MPDIAARLLALDTCAVSDALDKLGLPGAVIGIGALTGPARVAGRVVTTKLGAPLPNLPKRHLGAGAVMAAERGDIIVVEHRGRLDVSGWGGLLSRGAVRAGILTAQTLPNPTLQVGPSWLRARTTGASGGSGLSMAVTRFGVTAREAR